MPIKYLIKYLFLVSVIIRYSDELAQILWESEETLPELYFIVHPSLHTTVSFQLFRYQWIEVLRLKVTAFDLDIKLIECNQNQWCNNHKLIEAQSEALKWRYGILIRRKEACWLIILLILIEAWLGRIHDFHWYQKN